MDFKVRIKKHKHLKELIKKEYDILLKEALSVGARGLYKPDPTFLSDNPAIREPDPYIPTSTPIVVPGGTTTSTAPTPTVRSTPAVRVIPSSDHDHPPAPSAEPAPAPATTPTATPSAEPLGPRLPIPEIPNIEEIETDSGGRISTRYRGSRATDRFNLYGVPLGNNTIITPGFYVALKSAENEYREQHPGEHAEYSKLMQHVHQHFQSERQREPNFKARRAWSSRRNGFGDVDLSQISFPGGFDPQRKWMVVGGGFMVGATGGHKRHGREIDWTYGSANSSLPIPLNLQRIMNKYRISSSSKNDAGHQHHLNFYPTDLRNSERRLNRAIGRQYHYRQLNPHIPRRT